MLKQADGKKVFNYRAKSETLENADSSPYSLSPVGSKSQKLLRSPRKVPLCRNTFLLMFNNVLM